MFEAVELVEGGAGGGEEDGVAGLGFGGGGLEGVAQGFGVADGDVGWERGGQLTLDLFGGGTDGVDGSGALAEEWGEGGIVAALVFAAEDEVDAAVEGEQGLLGGVDVGGLAVVVVINAADVADELQAVLDGLEGLHGLADGFGGDAGEACGGDGGEDVFDVVRAAQVDVGEGEDRFGCAGFGGEEDDAVAVDEGALFDAADAAEPEDLGVGLGGDHLGRFVFGVEDEEVGGGLVFGDASLGGGVVLEVAVAVQVVGCDVEHEGDVGVEAADGFELEGGDFEDVPGAGGAEFDEIDNGEADVATDEGLPLGVGEDMAEQRGGGGFAIGAGDGDDVSLERLGGEFELAQQRCAEAENLLDLRRGERDAGGEDDEVLAAEGEHAVAAGFDHHAGFEEGGDFVGEGVGGAGVRDGDTGTTLAEEERGGDTGFAEADDEDAFVLEVHCGQL